MSSDNSFYTENKSQWWKSGSLHDVDCPAFFNRVLLDVVQLRQLQEIQKKLDLTTLKFLELTFKDVDHQKINTELRSTICPDHLVDDDCRSCYSSDIEDDSENCGKCKRLLDEFSFTKKYLNYLALKKKYQ